MFEPSVVLITAVHQPNLITPLCSLLLPCPPLHTLDTLACAHTESPPLYCATPPASTLRYLSPSHLQPACGCISSSAAKRHSSLAECGSCSMKVAFCFETAKKLFYVNLNSDSKDFLLIQAMKEAKQKGMLLCHQLCCSCFIWTSQSHDLSLAKFSAALIISPRII